MSPLIAGPNRGYADWQRIANYDSASVYTAQNFTGNTATTGVLDVSRYAFVGGRELTALGSADYLVDWIWWLDAAHTQQIGFLQYSVSGQAQSDQYFRMFNRGPFVQVSWTGFAGANFSHTVYLMGTNREYPSQWVPSFNPLISEQFVNVNNGVTNFYYPQAFYDGPIGVWANCGVANVTVTMQFLDDTDNWQLMNQFIFPGAPANQNYSWVAPEGAWRMGITNNTGGAVNVFLVVTASATGST